MTVRNPQLFHSASVADLDKFVQDQEWVLEQKVDGMRCLTVITGAGIEFFTRGGRELKSSAAKLHFEAVRTALAPLQTHALEYNAEMVFDGELVTDSGILVLLDLPYFRARGVEYVLPQVDELWKRRDAMRGLWRNYVGYGNKTVTIVAQSNTISAKQALVDDVIEKNLEGFIAKRADSFYDEGQRVKHSLKIKLTQTADVVIMAKNSGESKHSIRGGDKINYEFGVYVPDPDAESFQWKLTHIGNCSGIGKEDLDPGEVAEVEYLYAGAGGKLVQPRLVKGRGDKDPLDCTIDQLKYVNKDVL